MKTFFKAIDTNGYIPLGSYHHASWLIIIPKGQLIKLSRNYTDEGDFLHACRVYRSSSAEKDVTRDILKEH